MRLRIEQELALLRRQFPDIEHLEHAGEDWFHLLRYAFPSGWRMHEDAIEFAPIVFRVGAGYPTTEPYAFCAPAGINYLGATPGNSGVSMGGESGSIAMGGLYNEPVQCFAYRTPMSHMAFAPSVHRFCCFHVSTVMLSHSLAFGQSCGLLK